VAVEQLTDENFEKKLGDAELAVVDFHAAWCGMCVIFRRKFVELASEFPRVSFFVCDVKRAPKLRSTVDIEEVPYFGLYIEGELMDGFSTTEAGNLRERLEACFGADRMTGGKVLPIR